MTVWCCDMTSPKSFDAALPKSALLEESQIRRKSRAGSIRSSDLAGYTHSDGGSRKDKLRGEAEQTCRLMEFELLIIRALNRSLYYQEQA